MLGFVGQIPDKDSTMVTAEETKTEQTHIEGLSDQEEQAAEAAVGPVSRWAIHRHLYDWVLSFAHHKHSTKALFGLSFAESSFFPIPPDVLLGPMSLGHRKKAIWFATVTTIASVLGAYLGYYIGYALIDVALIAKINAQIMIETLADDIP